MHWNDASIIYQPPHLRVRTPVLQAVIGVSTKDVQSLTGSNVPVPKLGMEKKSQKKRVMVEGREG